MALISLRQLPDHAAERGYGVPAFNVSDMEQIHAVEWHPGIPMVLHQDHGATPAVCQQCIRSGFTSVMMDGSLREDAKTPADYDYNIDVTRRVCEMAHAAGVSVEGELGCLRSLEAGEEDGVGAEGKLSHDLLLTDPEQAKDFVARTGVDALAIAIGTSHGAHKFTRQPTGDIRLAMTGAMRRSFAKDPSEFDPRKALQAATRAARAVCRGRFEAFGCTGQADLIAPIALEAMARRYH